MDRLSRPMVIALAATILLVPVWLFALRPKASDRVDAPLAPVQSVAKAKQASAAADAANARTQRATGDTPAATSAPAPAPATPAGAVAPKPDAAATKPAAAAGAPAPASRAGLKGANTRDAAVLRDIGRGKVVVLLFWNAASADDIATHDAVRGLDRHRGKVAVHVLPISRVGDYESITRGVAVNQSPTTLVIDRRRQARAIVGLSEPRELSQAVGDALVAGR